MLQIEGPAIKTFMVKGHGLKLQWLGKSSPIAVSQPGSQQVGKGNKTLTMVVKKTNYAPSNSNQAYFRQGSEEKRQMSRFLDRL